MSTRPTYTDPDIRSMADWRPAARAAQQAMEAVGREIARQRIAGAPDAVLLALHAAMLAIPYPAMPRAEESES
jgi:microcystin degradation protein MlrC